MEVYKGAVLKVCNGAKDEIEGMFYWKYSPQGIDFWTRRFRTGLDLEGAKALLEIVKTAKKEGTLV